MMYRPALFAAILFLPGASAFGQQRTVHLASLQGPQSFQEMATVLRTVADIRHLIADAPQASLSFSGTSGEIAAAEWLIRELDQPATLPPEQQQIRDTAIHQYRAPGAKDDVYRIFFLNNTPTAEGMQELLTALRTVSQITKIFNLTASRALAVRGTTAEIANAEWLLRELDQPANVKPSGTHEFRAPGSADGVTRIFRFSRDRTPKETEETYRRLQTTIRIRRVYFDTRHSALVMFGTLSQIEQAARLIGQPG